MSTKQIVAERREARGMAFAEMESTIGDVVRRHEVAVLILEHIGELPMSQDIDQLYGLLTLTLLDQRDALRKMRDDYYAAPGAWAPQDLRLHSLSLQTAYRDRT
jgi:hypothetical protein